MSQPKNKKFLKYIKNTDCESIAEILSKKSAAFEKTEKKLIRKQSRTKKRSMP